MLYAGILSHNAYATDIARYTLWPVSCSAYPTLCCKRIWVSSEIRLLPCKTLSQTSNLVDFSVFFRKGTSTVASKVAILWSPYGIGQTIYIFMLWFCSFFFSSPNLSRHRLDVCHTSTHGVAIVRI